MPEPVSTTIGICYLSYAVVQGGLRGNTAFSKEAQTVGSAIHALAQLVESSQALFGAKAVAISELRKMANECAEPGWDGEDANPINPLALYLAECFVRALPDSVPLPEFAPDPDGSISLDRMPSRHRLFSISVGATNRLAYAWLDGTDKGHAVAGFDGERIPQRIIEGITATVNHGNITLRLA